MSDKKFSVITTLICPVCNITADIKENVYAADEAEAQVFVDNYLKTTTAYKDFSKLHERHKAIDAYNSIKDMR